MSIMNEKAVHGKALMPYIPPALEKQIAQGLVHAKQVGSEEEALAMLRNPVFKMTHIQAQSIKNLSDMIRHSMNLC